VTRREFIHTGLAGITAASIGLDALADENKSLTIERIDVYPVRYPTVMRFKFFEGPTSGGGRPAILIKITASDGTVGWGESVPIPRWSYETLEGATATIENYLKPILIGLDPFDLRTIHETMNREVANSFSTGQPITKAGIDIALHDLIGKALGVNLATLWGRSTKDDLLLSWTLNPRTLDDLPDLVQKGLDRGFANFNVKVAPDPEFDIAMCAAVKEMVPDTFLWADANGGYDLATALDAAPRLADIGVPVLEQPIPANNLTGYQRLRKQGALPIIMDEGVVSPTDLHQFIQLGCLDGMAMKPARCGGLVSAVQQIKLVQDAGLMFLGSGLTDPDVSLAASVILYSAFGLEYPAALNGPQFLGESVITEPFIPRDGRIPVPKGPGLGITVDESKLAELAQAGE